jgi:hypothetical protein
VRVERVGDDPVEAEGEGALSAPARTEQEEALAVTPLEIELAQRGRSPSDVPDGERLDAGELH